MYGLSDEVIDAGLQKSEQKNRNLGLIYALQGVLKDIDTISESTDDWSKTRLEELYVRLAEIIENLPE